MERVVHGIAQAGWAPIEDGVIGTPSMIPGAKSASVEAETTEKVIYADNIKYFMVSGNTTVTPSLTVLRVPKEYAQYAMGWNLMANGMITDTGIRKAHVLFYVNEVETDEGPTKELHYFYNVKAGDGTVESATDEDEITEQELEIPLTAIASGIAVDDAGAPVTHASIVRTTENAALFDEFITRVLLPTDTVEPIGG
jgi:hypothetical protein